MANAIIVHGCPPREEYYDPAVPSPGNHLWLPWLAKQLIVRDIPAHTPEMPLAYAPDYPAWRREFERYDIGPGTMLVGHSCGGGFLLRWLSEHPGTHVGRVVLVAPWLDPFGDVAPAFFDFRPDPALVSRTARTLLFHSDDDSEDIQESVCRIRGSVEGIGYREFQGYGHFTSEARMADAGARFPELLDALVGPAPA